MNYDQVALNNARNEISQLTPEKYLDLISKMEETFAELDVLSGEIDRLRSQSAPLPEAPASMTKEFFGTDGGKTLVTARGNTLSECIAKIVEVEPQLAALGYSRTSTAAASASQPYQHTQPAQAHQPQTMANGTPDLDVFQVQTVGIGHTTAGVPHLVLRGGIWTKFGVRAYEEILPPEGKALLTTLQPNVPVPAPAWCRIAEYSKSQKKVIGIRP